MSRKVYEFQAVIEPVPDKGGAYIRFPHDIREEFGKGRVKVNVAFDGEPYWLCVLYHRDTERYSRQDRKTAGG